MSFNDLVLMLDKVVDSGLWFLVGALLHCEVVM